MYVSLLKSDLVDHSLIILTKENYWERVKKVSFSRAPISPPDTSRTHAATRWRLPLFPLSDRRATVQRRECQFGIPPGTQTPTRGLRRRRSWGGDRPPPRQTSEGRRRAILFSFDLLLLARLWNIGKWRPSAEENWGSVKTANGEHFGSVWIANIFSLFWRLIYCKKSSS